MIVDVDLIVFNRVFSRAVDLNLCYIKDIISHIIVHNILFFEKKAPGRRPAGGFTQMNNDRKVYRRSSFSSCIMLLIFLFKR
jgi:hypothetical protein